MAILEICSGVGMTGRGWWNLVDVELDAPFLEWLVSIRCTPPRMPPMSPILGTDS